MAYFGKSVMWTGEEYSFCCAAYNALHMLIRWIWFVHSLNLLILTDFFFEVWAINLKDIFIFRADLVLEQNWVASTELPYCPLSPPLWISHTRAVPLLKLMHLHWHIIHIQSPQFTLGVTHCCALRICTNVQWHYPPLPCHTV